MKKTILALASLLAVGGLASCNSDANKMKVGLITLHDDNSTYDKNFIDAFEAACKAKGVKAVIKTGVDEKPECTTAADNMVEDGVKLVFADSFGHEPYLKASAEKHADVQFCHATGNQAHTYKLSNFHNAFASIYEGRYLAGVAAGMKLASMNTDHKIGYIAAHPYAEVISGYTSFFLGVRSIVSDVTMEVTHTNSWYDETLEGIAATTLINNGCKLISQHADSWGAPTVCEEKKVPNVSYNGSTESRCEDTFVISSKIDWQPYFEHCIDAVKEGKAIETDYTGTVATGSVKVTDLGKKATKGLNIEAKLTEVKGKLADGSLKVFDTEKFTVRNAKADASPFSKAGFITMDDNGKLTGYQADVDFDEAYTGDHEAIVTKDGKTYFDESSLRSAPYFDIVIDGITVLDDTKAPSAN